MLGGLMSANDDVQDSPYQLGPELGRGGMASVHFGLLRGDLGFSKVVAIKRIHPALTASPQMEKLFREEARIVARIRHPNVVTLLDVVAKGDELSLVLEYVHGESLGTLIETARAQKKTLPVGVAVAIAIDVLHGLAAAHEAVDTTGENLGIVHRDVSPQNVLVGADGAARLLDFGIAKANHRATVTRDGRIKGKLAYMAPEQLGGDAEPRSDVYAAALVLWEMLAGKSPFDGAMTEGQLIASVLAGLGEKAGAARPDLPKALDDFLVRALEVAPSKRQETAAIAARELEATGLAAARSEVQSMVGELASEALRARAEIVRSLEQGDGTTGTPRRKSIAPRPSAVDTSATTRPGELHIENAPTTPALVVSGAPAPASRVPSSVYALVALALVFGVASLVYARVTRTTTTSTSVPAPASAAPAEPSIMPVPATSVVVIREVAPPPNVPTVATTRPVPRPARPTKRAGTGPMPASSVPGCAIPYVIGSDGIQHYRRECFPE